MDDPLKGNEKGVYLTYTYIFEYPGLKKLHGEIKKRYSGDVELVMMQLREPFTDATAMGTAARFL